MNVVKIIIYVIAGVVIVFSVITFFASCAICVGKMYSCRIFLYSGCCILSIAGIICFAISLLMSVTTAGLHYGCQYVEGGLQTKS